MLKFIGWINISSDRNRAATVWFCCGWRSTIGYVRQVRDHRRHNGRCVPGRRLLHSDSRHQRSGTPSRLFFQIVGRARLAESSLPLPNLNTSVRIDAIPFFRIDAYANVRCFEIDPHPPRILRRNELADMFRRLCMPADYGVDFSGLENFFGFRLPESIAEDGQFPESFR